MSNAKKAKLSKHEPSFTCDCLVCVTHAKKMVYDMDTMDNGFYVTCEKGMFECWRHDRFMFDLLCKSPVCPAFCANGARKIVPSVRMLTDLEVVYASLPKLIVMREEVVIMYAPPVDDLIVPYRRADDYVSEVLGVQGMTWLNSGPKLLAGGRKKMKKEQPEQDVKPLVYRGPKALPDNFIVTLKGRYGPTLRMPYPERPWTFNHLSMTNVDNLCLDYFAHMSALYVNYCVKWSRVSFNLSCDTDRVASMFLGLVGRRWMFRRILQKSICLVTFIIKHFLLITLWRVKFILQLFLPKEMALRLTIIEYMMGVSLVRNYFGSTDSV